MHKKGIWMLMILIIMLFCGCQMRTVDEMYAPPVRSEDFNSLQSAINSAMTGMEYCAPVSGENQQIVQTADLDGDGEDEYLLFAKGGTEHPLTVLIFVQEDSTCVHKDTINLVGSTFDRVEYAQIDGMGGVELVVGSQVSDQVSRSVSVFRFVDGQAHQLVTADYLNFLTVDLDRNSRSELFVIRSGPTETDRGVVELFGINAGVMERSIEVSMSETADKLKRILVGQLHGGEPAVYIASAVDEDTLITDVYALVNGVFTNVSLSNESGTSIKTMRNYFVYADDIDADGIMELPCLVPTRSIDSAWHRSGQNLIRWYSMQFDGTEVDKLYTYHHFLGGWYMQIDNELVANISVVDLGNVCDFYVWDGNDAMKVMTVYALTGQSREEQSVANGRFVLHKSESVIYSASLDHGAAAYSITPETVVRSFHMIHEHWKTGET